MQQHTMFMLKMFCDSTQIGLFSESKRSYQMSSFVEAKALEHLTKTPVEFVEHPLKQPISDHKPEHFIYLMINA